jgi:hypothetical protein
VILLENNINYSIRAEVYHPKLRLVFKYKAHSNSRRCHGEELILHKCSTVATPDNISQNRALEDDGRNIRHA